jgi:hypothetical protein
VPAGELIDQSLGILALVRVALVVDQGDLALAAGELQDVGADQAGEVEAVVVAVLLPVEAGAALLAVMMAILPDNCQCVRRSRRARSCCQLT